MSPAVPYTSMRAAAKARRPAPRADRMVPSTSKRTRRTGKLTGGRAARGRAGAPRWAGGTGRPLRPRRPCSSGHPHPDNRGQVLRAGAVAALLPAAQEDGSEAHAGTYPEGPRARRPVDVVARHGDEVESQDLAGQRNAPDRAHRVDVQWHARAARDSRDLADRLKRPHLSAGRADGDEGRVR